MGPQFLNRIAILLAFAGIFVAGVLSLGHALQVDIPCGAGVGCNQVSEHPTAYWGGIPVAYFGLGAYLVLAVVSAYRGIKGLRNTTRLGALALLVSGAGAILSLFLQYQAMNVIKAYCPWCLASAVIMSVSFLLQAFLAQLDAPESPPTGFESGFVIAVALTAAVGLGAQTVSMLRGGGGEVHVRDISPNLLIPADAIRLGPDSAPIKVVEFSDLLCDSCRRHFPTMKELVKNSGGRVQWVFRHFPLYKKVNHEMALPGAFAAEVAAEKGRAWEFLEAYLDVDQYEMRELKDVLGAAQRVGIDPKAIEGRMKDTDPAFSRVYRDIKAANDLGIKFTPTFIVLAPGQPQRAAQGGNVFKLLEEPAYQRILNAK